MSMMQVTFNNVIYDESISSSTRTHTTLMFEIEFRGKTYHCVGHLKQLPREQATDQRVQFAGYCGYNGPIDIQRLRDAAVDYYDSLQKNRNPSLRIVGFNVDTSEVSEDNPELDDGTKSPQVAKANEIRRSYEFNVGKMTAGNSNWQEAV